MLPRIILWGIGLSIALAGYGAFYFMQTNDPMIFLFSLQPIVWMWAILLVVHVLTRGIPVRIVSDERKGP